MDSRKRHHYFKVTKSNSLPFNSSFHRNNYESKGKYSYFKSTRLQKQPYKKKNEFTSVGNFRSTISHKKTLPEASKKQIPSPEDTQEEERERKLTDTVNKLLTKIKTWSAENNCSEDLKKSTISDQQLPCNLSTSYEKLNEPEKSENCSNVKLSEREGFSINENSNESKPKRIAHSTNKISKLSDKKRIMSKNTSKNTKISNTIEKYDINNAAVKDIQNQIQHKLINEIMQMPRENLQNVLNNPKINPIMQIKMSHLVRKNKLLIAQKLRALAESKMSSKSCSTNPQILFDIDKLIDPVFETDFSALPYELIRQMEDIFQVQFDYSGNSTGANMEFQTLESEMLYSNINSPLEEKCNVEEDNKKSTSEETIEKTDCFSGFLSDNCGETNLDLIKVINGETGETNCESNCILQSSVSKVKNEKEPSNSFKTILSNEDLTMYECSTDEDEDTNDSLSLSNNNKNTVVNKIDELNKHIPHYSSTKTKSQDATGNPTIKKRKLSAENQNEQSIKVSDGSMPIHYSSTELEFSGLLNSENNEKSSSEKPNENECSIGALQNAECLSFHQTFQKQKFCSTGSQTKNDSQRTTETQTETQTTQPEEMETVYGLPLPKKSTEETSASLLQEANSIQNLINKLSERKFMIFLKLARLDPLGNFVTDNRTQFNFIDSVTSGNIYLTDSLKQFFSQRNLGENSRTHYYKRKKCNFKNKKTNKQ